MKILHVISQLAKGGAERVAVELAHRFNRSGDKTMVVPSEYLQIVITRR